MLGRPNTAWMETMIKKHGSREAVIAEQRRIGAMGGRKGHTGGFYANRELARTAGTIGGRISRRGKRISE